MPLVIGLTGCAGDHYGQSTGQRIDDYEWIRMNHSAAETVSRASAWSRLPLQALAAVGSFAFAQWDDLRHAAAVIGTVLGTNLRPRYWSAPVRKAFARQVLINGVGPVGFVCAVAAFVGISVVVQLAFWTGEAGQ